MSDRGKVLTKRGEPRRFSKLAESPPLRVLRAAPHLLRDRRRQNDQGGKVRDVLAHEVPIGGVQIARTRSLGERARWRRLQIGVGPTGILTPPNSSQVIQVADIFMKSDFHFAKTQLLGVYLLDTI